MVKYSDSYPSADNKGSGSRCLDRGDLQYKDYLLTIYFQINYEVIRTF